MDTTDRSGRAVGLTLTVAAALRRAARLRDPARRADAVWEGLGRLRPPSPTAASILDRLEDDGAGEAGVPDPRSLIDSARELEKIAATARGVGGGALTDPGRIRSPAMRDHPTVGNRARRRRRRRRTARRR